MLALGTAFSTGGNTTVTSLKLDYNPRIGTEGLITLCDGLMTNSTLEVRTYMRSHILVSLSAAIHLLGLPTRVCRHSPWNAVTSARMADGCCRGCFLFQALHSSSLR